jgi:uncharacterized protein YodC (DUF2158 family)
MDVIRIGDVVTLRSGGCKMTVTYISEGKDPGTRIIECSWFEGPVGNKQKRHSSFPIEALSKVDP